MKEGKLIGKIFRIALAILIIGVMIPLVAFGGQNQVKASPTTIYVPDDYSTIQAAVNASSPGDTIIVRDGTYTENVNVNKDHLTIQSKNGANSTIVQATSPNDYYIIEITASYVNINGFTVTGATSSGIYLNNVNNCNISGNKLFDNGEGIWLNVSNDNILTDNTVLNNRIYGILLDGSYGNILIGNNVSNSHFGIILWYAGNNTLSENSMSGNNWSFGVYGWESEYIQNIDTTNKVDGKSIQYLVDRDALNVDSSWDVGYLAVVNSRNITVKDLTLTNNLQGVLFACTTNSTIENVDASNNSCGIHLADSTNNALIGNNVSNNDWGIRLEYSGNNTLRNNIISGSMDNFGIEGYDLSHYIQDIDISNKVDGKPIQYLVNQEDLVIDSGWDVGYLGIVNSNNITIKDLTLVNNRQGVLLAYTSDSRIENVNVSNNDWGIHLVHSSNNTLIGNNFLGYRGGSSIYLMDHSNNNTLINNNLLNNWCGVYLAFSNGNILTGNSILNNTHGIYLIAADDNIVYLNEFNNYWRNVYSDSSTNMWNSHEEMVYTYNGHTFTNYLGNYWSDYTGNDANDDGIGDTPYPIDSNADNYPLMEPFPFIAHLYSLNISTTAGGSVTTPGVGNFTYEEGTVVNLVAAPIAGYHFVNWTGDVGTIANTNAASTNITMNGDYEITARFMAEEESRNIIATYGRGYLENVNGLLVLHVKGSPYEMGYQNGFLLRDNIQAAIQNSIQGMINMGYSYEYLVRCAQAMEPYIPQEYIEEMQGLADGASMNYTDVLLDQICTDIEYYGSGWMGCSGFIAFGNATKDGHLYHGRNLDWVLSTGESAGLITVYESENGNTFVNVGFIGIIGVFTGMNKKGLTVELNLSASIDRTLDGMPAIFMLKKILQYSNNLVEAIDIIRQTDRTQGWDILLGDGKNLNAAAVEISDNYCKVFWSGDPAEDIEPHYSIPNIIRRTNHYIDPELAATQRSPYDPRIGYGWSWDRYDKLSQLIDGNYGNIDAQMSIEFLRTPPIAWAEINLQSMVFDSTDLELWIANSAFNTPAYEEEYYYLSYHDLFPEYPPAAAEIATATGTGTANFNVSAGTIENITAVAEETLPTEGKPNLEFPHGFFSFNITGLTIGATVTVTIELPSAVPVGTQYWKYGPTLDNPTAHWYQLPMGDDDGDNVITITLVDGSLGDDDLTANGVIVDQGGPGNPPSGCAECDQCGPESPCPATIPQQCPTRTAGGGLLWSLLSTTYIMGKAVGDVTETLAGTLGCWVDQLAVPTFGMIGVITDGLGGLISGVGKLVGMPDIFDPIGEMLSAISSMIKDALTT